ncbi:MAG: UDP-N-acetylglucosamine 2-epimerase (non-hydrolyzing) [Chromatiales bacterium]|nr:UDP-N-acetylglucosamine 2-epimerase (non-hydrolyzing) [Chromatiales bacterium]
MSLEPRLVCVVGARPNFMKIAPIMRALVDRRVPVRPYLVHTGQHYDEAMKDSFFRELAIPEPDVDLGVGSGSHAVQTAEIMKRFEPVLDEEIPAAVLVVGDVNSTVACALVAVKKGIPVIHVEAGLRSGDRSMPEEINRLVTDRLSDLLFTTERSAEDNLQAEGVAADAIHFVGNVMIDTLFFNLPQAVSPADTLRKYGLAFTDEDLERGFALLTLHRPSNVDDPQTLRRLLGSVAEVAERVPVLFPVHPRTRKQLERFDLLSFVAGHRIALMPPLAYLELLGLMSRARVVLTDSGGIQEETTALGIPCVTLRENTERPITVSEGTNTVVGSDPDAIRGCVDKVFSGRGKGGRVPELWDGRASERIADVLKDWIATT